MFASVATAARYENTACDEGLYYHCIAPSVMIGRTIYPINGIENTHYKSIIYYCMYLSDNQFAASHRSHKSHEERIATLAFAIRLNTLGEADKLLAFCDVASVSSV